MRFSLSKKSSLEEISKVCAVAGLKSRLAFTQYVVIEVSDKLNLKATNLDIGYETSVFAEIRETGSVAVHGNKFLEIVKSYPNDVIPIKVEKDIMEIGEGSLFFTLKTVRPEDIPEPKSLKDFDKSIKFNKKDFENAVSVASKIIVKDGEKRQYVYMVGFKKADGGYHILSTDSKRMTISFLGAEGDGPDFFNIPKSSISSVLNCFDGEIFLSGNDICSKDVGTTTITQLEGQFPDINTLASIKSAFSFDLNKKEFLHVLKRCLIVCGETSAVKLEASRGKLTLSASDPEVGDFSESISCDDHLNFEIAVNGRFLLFSVLSIDDESLRIGVTDQNSPLFLESKTRHIIMPIKM